MPLLRGGRERPKEIESSWDVIGSPFTPPPLWEANAQTVAYVSVICKQMAGWSSYRDLYGAEEPRSIVRRSAFSDATFENLPRGRTLKARSHGGPNLPGVAC